MKKLTLISILLISFSYIFSQHSILIFKKKNKTIENFWVGSMIAFQLKDGQWQKGEITSIRKDSFFIRPSLIKYNFYNTDTFYYNVLGFSIHDIYAIPKRGVLIDYKDGQYQISMSAGHQHWYWVKSGWIFRTVAIGAASLIVINTLVDDDLSISDSKAQLGAAALVFVGGMVLKKTYKLTLRVGKKYRMEAFELEK